MKQNHTDVTIVLDRSGSMEFCASDTIGGFNTFLKVQKAVPGSASITLHQFDHEHETLMNESDIQSARELTSKTFVPRGNTALYDAIGKAIVGTGERLKNKPEHERAENVVFVIITDGHENASTEYAAAKVAEMIKHQRDVYKWQFVFLGARQDAVETAGHVGITADAAMSYADNTVGTQAMFAAVGSNLRSYRMKAKKDMAFEAKQRADQRKAGAHPESTNPS